MNQLNLTFIGVLRFFSKKLKISELLSFYVVRNNDVDTKKNHISETILDTHNMSFTRKKMKLI